MSEHSPWIKRVAPALLVTFVIIPTGMTWVYFELMRRAAPALGPQAARVFTLQPGDIHPAICVGVLFLIGWVMEIGALGIIRSLIRPPKDGPQ